MCALLIAIVACAALASAAPEPQTQACADFGRCSVDADHSLLQANVNFHRSQGAGEEAELEAEFAYRLAQLKKRTKKYYSEQDPKTTLAFDCGSSGSNIQMITVSNACQSKLDTAIGWHELNMEAYVSSPPFSDKPTKDDPKLMAAKNDDEVKPEQSHCTVSQAFVDGVFPIESCANKWNAVKEWKAKLEECFPSPGLSCWAAGTAGNRLAKLNADKTGWSNFKKWLGEIGVCDPLKWSNDATFQSYPGSFTIPGTAEAAMEVETIIDKGTVATSMAFGSAGGSSAQFGVKLDTVAREEAWQTLIKNYGTKASTFECTNYWSEVDTLPADFLNTYTASDGSKWGVGSFLGSDACPKEGGYPWGGPVTTMGGMAAMKCGLLTKLTQAEMDGPTGRSQIQTAMEQSGQATFAEAFKSFIETNYYTDIVEKWESSVRFVAKTFGVISNGKGFNADKVFAHPKFGTATKMSYSYMVNMGLMPQQFKEGQAGDIVATEMKQNKQEKGLQKDEYAWLMAASQIGLFKSEVCPSGKCVFASSVGGLGDGIAPCKPKAQPAQPGYMKSTASSRAKTVQKGHQPGYIKT